MSCCVVVGFVANEEGVELAESRFGPSGSRCCASGITCGRGWCGVVEHEVATMSGNNSSNIRTGILRGRIINSSSSIHIFWSISGRLHFNKLSSLKDASKKPLPSNWKQEMWLEAFSILKRIMSSTAWDGNTKLKKPKYSLAI